MAIEIKSREEIEKMRKANKIVVEVHHELCARLKSGMTTRDLDRIASKVIAKYSGAEPAFLGYNGFPASICVSIDDEVVHGIPSQSRRIHEGMIVSIDVGVKYCGFIGDAAVTYSVGRIDPMARKLLETTRESLYRAIENARVGKRVSDIGYAVESYVIPRGFSVVTEYVGHGVGRNMHEEPQIPNFGPPGQGPKLVAGMTLAIEPMVNEGKGLTKVLSDGWTVVTADGKRSAHFEHSIAITSDGPEILSDGLPVGF